ncbi:RWD-domain-containing protein [Stereum hirsutum FP-91666 SS1]|uniref:RWD-domain-containing protein n=1 Tax=Stereum hirsutum (strain FP-91666) TaxID=721885 RepID=UPI000440C719|nr:RWD-domain-containing protein [Stereum hirsutum FP-91666 SS1]EIM89982.1 RWD-domain-containing protein [Stereum hirsutum FP-91666 SS1]
MSSDVLIEEFEVLESIYPDEFTKLTEREIKIDVEPEDFAEVAENLKLSLSVQYPDGYPDVIPELTLETLEGELDESETTSLLDGMRAVGEENMGMAMTFAMVSNLREQLSTLIHHRAEEHQKAEMEKEQARTRGTPVTVDTFMQWKKKFDQEIKIRKTRQEEERMRGLSSKEREEYKKIGTRPTGRQLFERDRTLAIEDSSLVEEGTESVDVTQYERRRPDDEEEDGDRVEFSDSD